MNRMHYLKSLLTLLVITVLSLLTACAHTPTAGTAGPAAIQGVFEDWNGLIDKLEIVEPFNVNDYAKIVVLKIDTSSTPLPPKDENTYQPTTIVRTSATSIFSNGLKEGISDELKGKSIEIVQSDSPPGEAGDAKVLMVRGKVTEMNPGSQALRYWVGFGAGQSRVEVEGEVVDARSGRVLLKFKHARSSGIGILGGDYQKFLTDDTHDVGEDVGRMIALFRPENK